MRKERDNRCIRMTALEYLSHKESLVRGPYIGEVVDGVVGNHMSPIFAWTFYKFDQVLRVKCVALVLFCLTNVIARRRSDWTWCTATTTAFETTLSALKWLSETAPFALDCGSRKSCELQ